jgi:hypothetical protein
MGDPDLGDAPAAVSISIAVDELGPVVERPGPRQSNGKPVVFVFFNVPILVYPLHTPDAFPVGQGQ